MKMKIGLEEQLRTLNKVGQVWKVENVWKVMKVKQDSKFHEIMNPQNLLNLTKPLKPTLTH